MSRCFPFPPPGYTKNTKVEDLDLLKKEKHREKKHKKDKEKKDSIEKREKDKSDGKHKEKKDKKEKHRDKKKEKDRDTGKHKSGSITPDDKRNIVLSGTHNLAPSEISKIRESDRGAANLAEKRFGNGDHVNKIYNPAFESKNNSPLVETKSFRNASESGQGSIHKERTVNQLPLKDISTESKEIEMAKVRNITRPQVDGKVKRKDETAPFGRTGVPSVVEGAKPSGSVSGPSLSGMVQNRAGVGRNKEKIRDEVGGREQERQKGKDREKQIQKDKSMEKEKKSDEKVKVTSVEQKYVEQSKILDNRDSHLPKSNVKDKCIKETSSAQNGGLHNAPRDGNRALVAPPLNNLGKRKDAGFNGSYDEHSSGPNKLARTTTSTFPLTHNGRTLEPCPSSALFVDGKQKSPFNVKVEQPLAPADTQRPSINVKVDAKERKLNGTIDPCQTTANTERKPHPDSKYLGQVLSVPKMDDWLGIDDQEWLFDNNSSQTRKREVDSCEIDPTPQVWDTTLWLEPVDVYALPYVIPR